MPLFATALSCASGYRRFLATFATQIVSVAVGWQIYDLTRDPFDLGLVGIIQFLPSLLLVLVTGAIADRFGRRLIMGLSALLEAACAAAILLLTWHGLTSPLPIFAVLLVFGIARAFFGPASASLVANLVPQEDFANAIAWNSSAWQTATIVGPVAGGLLYGISAEAAYGTATIFMLGAALADLLDPQAGAAHRNRQADARHAVCRLPLHLGREDRARRDLARPVRRAAVGRRGAAAGLCARYSGTRPLGARPAARRAGHRRDLSWPSG